MAWYYARGDERMGPVDEAALDELVATGVVNRDTLVWREGMSDWKPYGAVAREVTLATGTAPSPVNQYAQSSCTECGRPFPRDEMLSYESHWVCADCKDVFFQRVREGGRLPGTYDYGGFWIRFVARFIDGVILGFVNLFQTMVQTMLTTNFAVETDPALSATDIFLMFLSWLISTVVALTYETFFVGRYAATPGKMIFGLKVIRSDGSRVTYWRAAGRYLGTVLSSMTLMIGYIIAAFDDEKRALHDHICDTRVVKK